MPDHSVSYSNECINSTNYRLNSCILVCMMTGFFILLLIANCAAQYPSKVEHCSVMQSFMLFFRAVATGPVSPVSTGPLFPSPKACLALQCERPSLPTISEWSVKNVACGISERSESRRNEQNRYMFLHVKLCRLASEKHCFGPEMVSEATS